MKLAHSYTPGYWQESMPDIASRTLDAIAGVMIPGRHPYPPGDEVGVGAFVAERCDPGEGALLDELGAAFVAGGADADALRALESSRPLNFGLLRFYVYAGYYCAPAVLVAVSGLSDYHGSPQPVGYAVDAEVPVPTVRRGAFVPTLEVRNVLST